MKLSNDQKYTKEKIVNWYFSNNKSKYITLGGYAGTGKTALIPVIKDEIVERIRNKKETNMGDLKIEIKGSEIEKDKKKNSGECEIEKKSKKKESGLSVAFCSYTGRAVQNLKLFLKKANSLSYKDKISTIHGLIYDPIENSKGVIIGWRKKEIVEDVDLIIIDEASMVNEKIWKDLLSFNIPIIAVGDHGQLPPINGNFNLMQKPHIKLEKIHRQEKGSPIIEVSIHARKRGKIPEKNFGKNVIKYSIKNSDYHLVSSDLLENYTNNMLILCGYNSTRNKINGFVRNSLGFYTPEPQPGDRVICLRNNHKKGIYNGMIGTIENISSLEKKWYEAEIRMDDINNKTYSGKIYKKQFNSPKPINFTKDRIEVGGGDLFDFGYALTVHKAQGSQSEKVVLFEERFKKTSDTQWKRWLYTGVTRAKKELYIFGR